MPTDELLSPLGILVPVHVNIKTAFQQVRFTTAWQQLMSSMVNVLMAQSQSGTTAQRPTKGLFPGRMYFDTSLGANGKPVWVNKGATGWVLADGTAA
jgi:hypothetical protein